MIALPGVAIHSKIYESSASVVYRGIREQDGQAIARSALPEAIVVKLLKQDYPSPQELTRYKQEYEITRSLNLPGVVKAYSQQDYQRTLAILLEDFGGESIERWMRQRPEKFCPMPLSNFFRLAIDITEILGGIHHANIIHKDINPGNIVFNPDTGVVKFIDFGIATQFNRTNPTFKSPHVLEGTLAYISPEQTGRMNRWLDYRTDFYSLGVTFYQLLTGQLPFPTTDILELVHCHIAKTPVPPHELNAAIPKAVSDIIMKLMAKNAQDRYGSAWGIKADLETCDRQFTLIGRIDRIQLGLQDISEQFHIPQKLYGREAEIGALLAAFDRVVERGNEENAQFNVEMMLVSGYAGVGKSALVQELYQPITAKRGYFIWGKFDQFDRNIPYSAIAQALQKLVQQLLGEPDEQVQRWRSHLLAALGSNGQIIIDAIPEVELIIGKQPLVPSVGATEAQNRFNLTFQKFVRVFCSKEHPLVIFLDDLQWIDSATLKLIELILLDEQTQYLFLIGAYRDNEVTPTHPLVLTLLELRKQRAVLQEITLAPLTLESLNQLIAETLDRNPDTVRDLAQLVLRKTEGNPFFSCEFLRMLYSENLLTFDAKQLNWQWNIAQIQARNITDNVVELLLLQLKKLPEETRQILRLAACVGSQFDLETLAIVCEKSPKAISLDLLAAIHAGLIQPLSELDENLLVQEYKFLHDRVQQAAYALIDESHKQVVHLQIGRNLIEKASLQQRSERLFEVVDHLNRGIELVSDRAQQNKIAKLNLIAGQKAKAATAYEAALKYFNTGLKLLNTESWLNEYDLTLALYSEAAGAAYLHGCFDEMEQFVEVVLNNAKTAIDKVQVYDSRIQRYLSQGNPKSAIKIGLEVLQLLEVILIETPSQLDVERELESTAAILAGREIEDLINLPKMTAPEPLAAMYILANIAGAAFIMSPALLILTVCKRVNLSIEYGNATWSPMSYANYGFVLCGVVQDIERGYKFGQLALGLVERLNTKKGDTKALMVSSIHVMHWKVHFRQTIPMLVDAYQNGVETGDFEFAGYSAYYACHRSFFVGESLTQLEQKTATYSKAIGQIRRENPSNWIAMLWQTILNLLGRSENPSRLIGSIYDEEQALSHAIAVKDGIEIRYFYLNKLILCYLFGDDRQAAQTAVSARQHFEEVTAITVLPLFCFYHSLVLLNLSLDASSSEKEAWLSCVSTNQEKMQKWAEYAPMNYLHKYHLVEAEKARVLGQFLEAEEFYERAISGASEHEFIQEEALAYELAAKHYLARGREKFAQTYMKEAHYCYERWGALAKVKDLESRYPQFFPQSSRAYPTSVPTTSGTTYNNSPIALDLAAVLKASQAISREIELEQLLRSLMQILIQNAGAQTGYLILENAGEWAIEASGELSHVDGENVDTTQLLQSIPTANRLPETIINCVIRTHESVILNDATREGIFINDPYIQQHQTKSIFCLPLLNQAKLVGVLYLENQLAIGAFTTERSQVLHLLSTQAAIAIENAKLYSKLCEGESRMKQFLEAVPVGIGVLNAAGRPYYFNQQATQLLGKGIDPSLTPDRLAEVYQTYLAGTKRKYPTEKLPIVRALSGERTRVDDVEIHQNNSTIPVEAWGTPVYDERGNIAYAIAAFQDITERKQAEKLLADYNRTLEQQVVERTAALQKSEANYRNLIQTANSIIVRCDMQRRIQYLNDCGLEFFGYEVHEILGRTLLETIVPEIDSCGRDLKPFVQNLFHDPESYLQSYLQVENENLCRDGRRVWVAWSNQAILDEQGQVVEILSVGNDITGRKQAEAALQRSEAKFRNIFENSQVGIFRTRLSDGLILDANQRFADLFGYDSPDEMIGKKQTTDCYVNSSDRHKAIELLKWNDELRNFEVQLRKRDGTLFWGLYSSRLNAADGCMEGVVADISDRKQAEVALQASEAELRALFSAIPDPLFIFTTEGQLVCAIKGNPSYGDLCREEYIGKTLHQLYAKEQADEFLSYIQQAVKTQQILTVEYSQWIAGREIWFSARIAPIRHEQVIWLARDITLQKQAEATSILEERNRMAREIHDTLAQAFTGILIQFGAATQVLTDDPEAIQTHLDTIEKLARTGLTEARRSVTALRPQLLEDGDLSTALDRLVTLMRATTDTVLIYQIQGRAYPLPAEVENHFLRIGQEALTNAIKYADASEIRIELVYDDARCCLRVKDNGRGFGVGSVPPIGGFGLLGMSERAERIGAQLRIESQPGQGTEIVVVVNS
ncbi:MAG: Serine/threonine-protein kinase PknD [Chroococcidiopsis sp. SAG 2025]|uniref:PAS domain S-box protein n=1 Tax=Chroococcidiopsis sp. SAG 2025 TaxID=171389 RepID=UPI0029371252|nr:PAS domain S-box protein [Chroococcidiopsis sp. SAG 2025]MDV2994905.1 Serine/threonine-protein kinase PknD [Chroococcidiopsis sp. SAG 2025]